METVLSDSPGKVFWLTGLAGAGKTTIGNEFYQRLKRERNNVIFLDGDELRNVIGRRYGYSLSDRKKIASMYGRLCLMISNQGIDVICATISMFNFVRKWNREHIKNYFEVYIKVPVETLLERDQKQLYSRSQCGTEKEVVGIDLFFEEPESPDLVLINDNGCLLESLINQLVVLDEH